MIAVLHLGPHDGAEFDLRTWTRIPDVVYARAGGNAPLGVLLSQESKPGSTAYRYAIGRGDEFHYRAEGVGTNEDLFIAEDVPTGSSL